MTEEALQAALWEIVCTVATESSVGYQDNLGCFECPFCNGYQSYQEKDNVSHEPGCIVTKARKLAEKGIQAEL